MCKYVSAVNDGCRREDQTDASKSQSSELPPKPVARRTKAPAGLNEMILNRHTAMFPLQKADATTTAGQETTAATSVKPPMPSFRKKPAPVSPEAAEQHTTSLELAAAFNKIHQRTNSDGSTTEAPQSADKSAEKISTETSTKKPSVKTSAAQRLEKTELAEKVIPEQPSEKLTTKTTAKSKVVGKLSVKTETPAEKQLKKAEKPEERSSVARGSGQQSAAANGVEIKPKTVAKPQPPTKTGPVMEKAKGTAKSNLSRVVKPTLSEPGTATTVALTSALTLTSDIVVNQERMETDGKSFEERDDKVQTSEILKVKLKPTSRTLDVCAPLSSRPARSDSSLNVVGLETNVDKENGQGVVAGANNKQRVGSFEQLESETFKTGDILIMTQPESGTRSVAEKKTELQITLKNTEPDTDSNRMATNTATVDSETTGSRAAILSTKSTFKTFSDTGTVSESNNKRLPESGGKSDNTCGKTRPVVTTSSEAASSPRLASFRVAKTTWEPKLASSVKSATTQPAQSSADCTKTEKTQTSDKDVRSAGDSSFVPVSRRVSMFASSGTESTVKTSSPVGRQYVGKATGFTVTPATSVNSDSTQSGDVSSGSSSSLTKTVVSRAKSTVTRRRDPPSVTVCRTDVTEAESCAARSKHVSSNTKSVQPTQQGTCEAKNEVVIKAAEVARLTPAKSDVKTSVSSWIKPSGTSSPKDKSDTTTSGTEEPAKPATGSSPLVSRKPSSVKPSRTSSPKNLPKESPQETSNTVELGKITGSRPSVQSQKTSSNNRSGMEASQKMSRSVIADDTTPSALKIMSTSVGGPTSSVVDLAPVKSDRVVKPKRSFGIEAAAQSPAASEPPWMAIAREKTRVWTDGKV